MIIIPRSEVCGLLFAMETAKMVGNKLPDFTFYFTQIFENKFTQGKIKLVQGIDILKRSIVLVNTVLTKNSPLPVIRIKKGGPAGPPPVSVLTSI
mgnify:CR=1 FL=1